MIRKSRIFVKFRVSHETLHCANCPAELVTSIVNRMAQTLGAPYHLKVRAEGGMTVFLMVSIGMVEIVKGKHGPQLAQADDGSELR